MSEITTVARVERLDGPGGLAIVQDAEEQRTDVITQGKFRFEIHHHPRTFTNRDAVIDFVRTFDDAIDIELVADDGAMNIEFNDDLI